MMPAPANPNDVMIIRTDQNTTAQAAPNQALQPTSIQAFAPAPAMQPIVSPISAMNNLATQAANTPASNVAAVAMSLPQNVNMGGGVFQFTVDNSAGATPVALLMAPQPLNGQALLALLDRDFPGIVGVNPTTGFAAFANLITNAGGTAVPFTRIRQNCTVAVPAPGTPGLEGHFFASRFAGFGNGDNFQSFALTNDLSPDNFQAGVVDYSGAQAGGVQFILAENTALAFVVPVGGTTSISINA